MPKEISVNLGNMLLSLSEIIDMANPYISNHQQRTALIAMRLANTMDLSQNSLEKIFASALLHDIGAITIEEKTLLHENHEKDIFIHCNRGAALVSGLPWFDRFSFIIKNHHTNWIDINNSIDNDDVLSAQIIHVADFIERSVNRKKCILHQNDDIIKTVNKLKYIQINEKVIDHFNDLAKKEEFWLELTSNRIYSNLLHNGPFITIKVSIDEISQLADLFTRIIDFKSSFTSTHTTGVEACTEKISKIFGFSDREVKQLKIAGAFHDIGKLVIPRNILNKPATLTKKETALMRSHAYYTFIALNSIKGLQKIAVWAAYHHEKNDGSGYPFHYKEQELDSGSRIIAVADIFTALTEDRPYRKGLKKNEIYSIFKEHLDLKQQDENIVSILFDNYDEISCHVKKKQKTATKLYNRIF